jgi:hypothetical protein
MQALKLITLGGSLNCGISLSKFEITSNRATFSHAVMPALRLESLGEGLNSGKPHSTLKATSNWAHFSHALMPDLEPNTKLH